MSERQSSRRCYRSASMAKLDLDEIARRLASMTGLANPDTLSKMQPGAIFEVDRRGASNEA
jgi:hypothetical protein